MITLPFSCYLPNSSKPVNAAKIQWMGKTNVLATLVFNLWQGQDKGKVVASTPPRILAQKKDLEALLINNFIDSKGGAYRKGCYRRTIDW